MLTLDDPIWMQLRGGPHGLYNAVPALRRIQDSEDVDSAWSELCDGLHHQGGVDDASYAAPTFLVDLRKSGCTLGRNLYALLCVIEVERTRHANPPIPQWLQHDYSRAWESMVPLAVEDLIKATDQLAIRNILAVIAIAKGDLKVGCMLGTITEDEMDEVLDQYAGWSDNQK